MKEINDGGPAFPFPDIVNANGDVQSGCNGMSLRDYFAGQALTGLLSNTSLLEMCDHNLPKHSTRMAASIYAYGLADSMIKARTMELPE